MNRYVKAVAAALVMMLSVGAADAAAQVGISVGGGPTFPIGTLADEFDMGFNVQAAAEFAPAILPVGVRVDGAFNRFPADDGHLRVISGSLNAVINVPAVGIAPYVIGGLGVYSTRGEHDDADHEHESTTNVGANIGAGVRLGFARLSLFAETRFHNIFSEGEQARFVPLTVGLRF